MVKDCVKFDLLIWARILFGYFILTLGSALLFWFRIGRYSFSWSHYDHYDSIPWLKYFLLHVSWIDLSCTMFSIAFEAIQGSWLVGFIIDIFSNYARDSLRFRYIRSSDSILSNNFRILLIFVWVPFKLFICHPPYSFIIYNSDLFIYDSLVVQDSFFHVIVYRKNDWKCRNDNSKPLINLTNGTKLI